jgi:hypothetical protein
LIRPIRGWRFAGLGNNDALLLEGSGRVPMPPLPVIYTRSYTEAGFITGELITPSREGWTACRLSLITKTQYVAVDGPTEPFKVLY